MAKPKLKIRRRTRRNGHKHDVVLMKQGSAERCYCGSGNPRRNCCGTVLGSSSTRKGADALLGDYREGRRALPVGVA
jgi:hypothetical protein